MCTKANLNTFASNVEDHSLGIATDHVRLGSVHVNVRLKLAVITLFVYIAGNIFQQIRNMGEIGSIARVCVSMMLKEN